MFYNSESNIHDIRPFCRQLFCHCSVVKYTSSLLQQLSRYETLTNKCYRNRSFNLTSIDQPLHISDKSFFSISTTLALEYGLLTPLQVLY